MTEAINSLLIGALFTLFGATEKASQELNEVNGMDMVRLYVKFDSTGRVT